MAQPSGVVERIRTVTRGFVEQYKTLLGELDEYEKLGAASARPYFFEADGTTPRTDIDITVAQFNNAVATLIEIRTLINTAPKGKNLYDVAR